MSVDIKRRDILKAGGLVALGGAMRREAVKFVDELQRASPA